MITSAEQLEQWVKWVEDDPKEAMRAMQAKIDGQDDAGEELIKVARTMYGAAVLPGWRNRSDLKIDDDAGKSEADNGTWVQAWVWMDGFIANDQAG